MLGIALLADRGPTMAAAMAAALFAAAILLPVVLPVASFFSLLFIIGSAAVVAFVILKRGEIAALQSAGICLAILVAISLGLSGSAVKLPFVALVFWLPAIVAAVVLRRSVRLDLGVLVATACGLISVVGVTRFLGGREEAWRDLLIAQLGSAERTGLPQEQFDWLVDYIASHMTGTIGVSVMLVAICALFIARFWQASIVNPGGFQEEFHALSLGPVAAIVCVAGVGMSVVSGGMLWKSVAIVLLSAFFIQGLAIAHAIVKQRGLAKGWLFGLYALMVLVVNTLLLLAALGLADNIYRLRRPGPPST